MQLSTREVERKLHAELPLFGSGKARDTFLLPDYPDYLAVYVTNRISVDDHVLPFLIPQHGEVRNAVNAYFKRLLQKNGITTDLVAEGRQIDRHLPETLRGIPQLWKQMTIVLKADMDPIENIGRNYLTGSAFKQYSRQKGLVYGQQLPPGLSENQKLPVPIWTPTSKAPRGEHDQPLHADDVDKMYPDHRDLTLMALEVLNENMRTLGRADFADTKFEFGRDPQTGRRLVCDEVGTPDSSRIWPNGDPKQATDKDYLRAEMRKMGIGNFDPGTEEGQAAVAAMQVPFTVIQKASNLSLQSVIMTTGVTLGELQGNLLGV